MDIRSMNLQQLYTRRADILEDMAGPCFPEDTAMYRLDLSSVSSQIRRLELREEIAAENDRLAAQHSDWLAEQRLADQVECEQAHLDCGIYA